MIYIDIEIPTNKEDLQDFWIDIKKSVRRFYRSKLLFPYQRLTRGYSNKDFWDFEDFLKRSIVDFLKYKIENSRGYLASETAKDYQFIIESFSKETPDFEDFDETENGFTDYLKASDKVRKNNDKAMKLVAKLYKTFWD